MVSLKSFKPIIDGERDEPEQHQISTTAHTTSEHHLYRHLYPDQSSTMYSAHGVPINTKVAARGKLEVILNDNSLELITDDRNEDLINQNESNRDIDNNFKLNPTKMTTHNPLNKGSSESNIVNTIEDVSDKGKQDIGKRSVVKVSLKNSNSVDREIASEVQSSELSAMSPRSSPNENLEGSSAETVSPSSSSISIVVVKHGQHPPNQKQVTSDSDYAQDGSSSQSLDDLDEAVENQRRDIPTPIAGVPQESYYDNNGISKIVISGDMHLYQKVAGAKVNGSRLPGGLMDSRFSTPLGSEHFEIVWSNLSYRIEPKWYKKINYLDRIFTHFLPSQTIDNHSSATSTASSSAGMNDNQHQMHTSANSESHLHQTLNHKQKSSLDPLEIFTNLNGTIKSGQMTAVLGPSGAGKTTLLNCLTGKLRKGVSGHINLIGANGKHLKMCTIPQKDHLLELLTVEENLWFASKIKNPEYGFDHVKNIERVIDLLGLKRCRSAKIKKISGGQHKRVSIAQELLSNPDILVLDEPTSGLDSLTCFKTISMLRDLVELSASNDFMKPMAIIVTIHQPQPKVFNLFHHVYILANGGRVIYEGAPELSLDTITGVTGLQSLEGTKGTGLNQPGNIDPASFLIEIASEEYGLEPIKALNDYQRRIFYDTYNYSHHNQFNTDTSNNLGDVQFQYQGAQSGAKDNDGFTPDFENESKSREFSTLFVPNQMYPRSLKESNAHNEEKHGKNVISEDIEFRKGLKKGKKRKKFTYSLGSGVSRGFSSRIGDTNQSVGVGPSESSLYMSEQLLYTREANHKGRFWSHTATLTHRTLLTIRRDPLLMTSRVLFHLMIPILMAHVYGKATGAANACPHYESEIDITQIPSLVEGKRIEYMLEELHMSIENVSMFFIIMYAFAAAVLALNALSFPLNMQVLLKETRNGWYSMSSYVLAKTVADLPLELTMPCLTMALVYPLTGQPSSYLQWRMLTICLIMTLCSLIAQTQALILGALVMSSVQTAVFVSQASQLPWVILAGFTIRIKRLSEPLKLISLTSFYRLGCEAITLTRYGFGICPCDPQEITGEPVRLVGIPDQLRTIAQYWIDSMDANKASNNDTTTAGGDDQITNSLVTTTMSPTTTVASSGQKTDIFQHLANQLSYANSYGVNITSCADVAPDRIRAINLSDNWLVARIWHLFIMLIIMKVILYYAVKFSIGIRL